MYCPKCAAQNLDGAKFCRTCGVDISLVPQAVAGELAKRLDAAEDDSRRPRHSRRRERDGAPLSMEGAVVRLFMGVALGIIAFILSRPGGGGDNWWFYMLIPAFIFLGKGIGALARLDRDKRSAASAAPAATPAADTTRLQPPQRAAALPPRDTGELVAPPPSVTEATTRHLGVPVERKPRDV